MFFFIVFSVAVSTTGNYDVNSVVVDFSIDPAPVTLNPPLTVEFKHMQVCLLFLLFFLNYDFNDYFYTSSTFTAMRHSIKSNATLNK